MDCLSDKEQTILDLHPAIADRAVELYFEGKLIKEAIEQAKKELEGVIE